MIGQLIDIFIAPQDAAELTDEDPHNLIVSTSIIKVWKILIKWIKICDGYKIGFREKNGDGASFHVTVD